MRRTRTVGDFFLGGRSVGPWLSAFAYGTTYFSAVIFIGYAGKVGWGFGISALWIAIGNAFIGTYLAWRLLAKPTRVMTSRLQAMTMPGFLAKRFDSPRLKIVSALIIFVFLVPYTASVYMGLSYLFEQTFGISFLYANLFMAGLTAVFLVLGGYFAVALTDFIQGIIMLFGVGMMLFFVFGHAKVGSITHALTTLAAYNPKLAQVVGPPGIIPLASLVILTSLGTWGLPQMIQKFYAIKSEAAIKPARIVATVFALVVSVGAYGVGSVTRLFFDNKVPTVNGVPNYDTIIPQIIVQALPDVAAIVILLLVLSASMSTLSSLVLVSSSAVAIDLRQGITGKTDSSPTIFRLLCLIFVFVSVTIAILRPTFILNLMALSWGTVAGSFLGPYLYGLFWPRTSKIGVWAGLLTGLSASIILTAVGPQVANLLNIPAYLFDAPAVGSLSMLLPLLVIPIVSVFTPPLPVKTLQQAYGNSYQPKHVSPIVEESAR